MKISSEDTEIPTPINTVYSGHENHIAPKIRYKECQKNHAASMGGNATDGCGEFMPGAGEEDTLQFLTCSVCNCHRNFHRRDYNILQQVPCPQQLDVGAPPKKRFRTKFSQEQKEKMLEFAEKVGWKIQRQEDEVIQNFCQQIGIKRRVFKVWMHNNKYNLAKRRRMNNIIHHPNIINYNSNSSLHQ